MLFARVECMTDQRVDQRLADPGAAGTAVAPGGLRAMPLIAVSLGYFMVILDATIVTVALPSLGRDLGSSLAGLQWVVDAYTASLAGLLLLGCSLGDRLGSRAVFQALWLVHGRLGRLRAGALARRANRRPRGSRRRRRHGRAVVAGVPAGRLPRPA